MPDAKSIDQVLSDAVARGQVAGVVAAAARPDGTLYEGAFGKRARGGDQAMTMDTVFRIASMTKAVTGAAVMQQVERGAFGLDDPASEVLPFLKDTQVLDGFDGDTPKFRPPRGTVTARNLLTHTAGFVYDTWNKDMNRYAALTGLPAARTSKLAALSAPLGFDPGARWEYGINIDVAGRMVDVSTGTNLEAYLRRELLDPLGMRDTSFVPSDRLKPRLATVHTRESDGSLTPFDAPLPPAEVEFYPGGGGLFSTAPDYLRFLRALMNGGELDGARVLKPETVKLMGENSMGALNVLPMQTYNPRMSNPVDLFPDQDKKWGLTFLINTRDVPGRRRAGSLAWAGINNTYYWLDPSKKLAGVLMTQVLPFADATVLGLLDRFEEAVYASFG